MLRLAGQILTSPVAKTGYTVAKDISPYIVGGAIGVGVERAFHNSRAKQANLEKFEQLKQMGLSEKDLQQVALAMGLPLTVMEPTEYV